MHTPAFEPAIVEGCMLNELDMLRVLLAVLLLAVAGFCVFGFLMTFQPKDVDVLSRRIGYGLGVVASALGAVFVLSSRRRA